MNSPVHTTARRGAALVLVLVVVALAAALSYALLAGSALQAEAGVNGNQFAVADCLAESGANLAMYYLQYPCVAPPLPAGDTYWQGATNVSLDGSVPGTIDVTVTRTSPADPNNLPDGSDYDVVSTGKVPLTAGPTVSRTVQARVRVSSLQPVAAAGSFRGAFTVSRGLVVNGDLYSPVSLTLGSGALLRGTAYSPSGSALVPVTPPLTMTMPGNSSAADRISFLNSYQASGGTGISYVYSGRTWQAAKAPVSDLHDMTLGPTAGNPAGVYWFDAALKISSNLTVNGSLVVLGNRLTLAGSNNSITAVGNFPALVAEKDLQIYGKPRTLVINGLAYLGTGVTRAGDITGSVVTINGAVMMGSTAAVDATYPNIVVVNYNAAKAVVRDLMPAQSADSVKIVSWQP